MINKMLPKGYKFESYEVLKRVSEHNPPTKESSSRPLLKQPIATPEAPIVTDKPVEVDQPLNGAIKHI